ncbi:MAG: hypothetical protein GY730_01765 [bacterium]|nr:hypothetical protein [bacterium]
MNKKIISIPSTQKTNILPLQNTSNKDTLPSLYLEKLGELIAAKVEINVNWNDIFTKAANFNTKITNCYTNLIRVLDRLPCSKDYMKYISARIEGSQNNKKSTPMKAKDKTAKLIKTIKKNIEETLNSKPVISNFNQRGNECRKKFITDLDNYKKSYLNYTECLNNLKESSTKINKKIKSFHDWCQDNTQWSKSFNKTTDDFHKNTSKNLQKLLIEWQDVFFINNKQNIIINNYVNDIKKNIPDILSFPLTQLGAWNSKDFYHKNAQISVIKNLTQNCNVIDTSAGPGFSGLYIKLSMMKNMKHTEYGQTRNSNTFIESFILCETEKKPHLSICKSLTLESSKTKHLKHNKSITEGPGSANFENSLTMKNNNKKKTEDNLNSCKGEDYDSNYENFLTITSEILTD